MKDKKLQLTKLEELALKLTNWIGSPASLVVHSILFIASFASVWFGARLETVLLVLTTAVSLEAIYLAVFIQMTVNRNTQSLAEVEEDIEEIQKDVDDIQEDVGEIEKDIDEIQVDVDEIEKDDDLHLVHGQKTQDVLIRIQSELQRLLKEIEEIKKEKA
jgi:peptidoglycan hydrolase CwlO-like protein